MPDQETIRNQLTLLVTLRRRLHIQLSQQTKLGAYAPTYLQNEIDDNRAQIAKIREYLDRHQTPYEDDPADDEGPVAQTLAGLRRSLDLYRQYGAGEADQEFRLYFVAAMQAIRAGAVRYSVTLSADDLALLAEAEAQ